MRGRREHGVWSAVLGVACVAALVVGCRAGGDPAAEHAAQIEAGSEVYDTRCATCHEVEGGLGPRLSARALAGYETAARLVGYLRLTMPYGAAGTLSDDQYWSVVAYLAASRELARWEGRLEGREVRLSAVGNAENAEAGVP